MPRPCASAELSPARSARSATIPRTPVAIRPAMLATAAVVVDASAVLAAVVLARATDPTLPPAATLAGSGLAAVLIAAVGLCLQDYRVGTLLAGRRPVRRVLTRWLLAGGVLLVVAVVTGLAMPSARSAGMVGVAVCLSVAVGGRLSLAALARRWAGAGRLTIERLMLLGADAEVAGFLNRHDPARYGQRLVAAAVLRNEPLALGEDLALAVATARMRQPDRLVLLLPWTDQAAIGACVDALRCLPAAIHLGPTALMERIAAPLLHPLDPASSISLVRPPLSGLDRSLKRAFDVVAAGLALIALAPLLLIIAAAVKVDSPGPVFFRQRRTGFNQQPFRIIKFRSMTTLEDSAALRQVTHNDGRVTRVGRILRATSLDELPQLINVLAGDMSLIGPRPHALAHDQAFGRSHALYGRRHTIRPGITGWAQVRGFRGETDTPDKIEGRVRHDLDYIDNWSLWLDLSIMLRTVFSRQTFRNAK